MIQLPSALLEPPASAPHGKEPPGSSPDTPFATVLDDHQARTAVAEGHQQKRQDAPRGPAADGAGDDGGDAGDAPADPTSTEASALAALLGGVPLPAGVELTAVAIAAASQGDAPATARSPAGIASGIVGLAPAAAGDASTTAMPTGPSVPAAATALPLRPPLPAAADASGATLDQPAAPAAVASTAAARATRLADVLQSATARSASAGASVNATSPDTAATPPAATVAGAARSFGQAADQGATNGSAPQPAPAVAAQPAATASAQGATPNAATPAAPGVGLEHAVETVRLALRAAADRGVTHARISLTPRELGSIEVHLRQTADGLVARVVAEHATAAQLLHNAGGELRRQLESQGLTLLRLDIGASGEQSGRSGDRALGNGGAFGGGDDSGHGRNGGDADPLAPLDGTSAETSTTTTLALRNGALVDVLA